MKQAQKKKKSEAKAIASKSINNINGANVNRLSRSWSQGSFDSAQISQRSSKINQNLTDRK